MKIFEVAGEGKLHGLTVMSLDAFVKKEDDVEESNSAVVANTADRLTDKDDGRTAKLRAAGDARREQHLKGRDIAKNDRSSKDAWGDLTESYQGHFPTKEAAIAYAKESVKKFRDPEDGVEIWAMPSGGFDVNHTMNSNGRNHIVNNGGKKLGTIGARRQGVAEAPGDFGLGANYRAVPDEEMQAYMDRSKTLDKTKRDKFDYPYLHRSNIEIKDESGKTYDTEALKKSITQRPKSILGQNAKMQHSETGDEIVYNIGLPALKGLAVNEKTGQFVVVDTCPGAGACQTFCYAMRGSYVMFKAVSMNLARMLNYLLNDPEGFADQLDAEVRLAQSKNRGVQVVVRWHDAGDFFSPEYLNMAYKVAAANPKVQFYAYTKMASAAQAERPTNFNMNFSQGAKRSQEKQIDFQKIKHSRVIPNDLFWDLIVTKNGKPVKDAQGRNHFSGPEAFDTFKDRLAQKFKVNKDSIISYDQLMKTPVGDTPYWNVVVVPGDGDNSANRADVIGSYLLFH
jgi:hypothetical protein